MTVPLNSLGDDYPTLDQFVVMLIEYERGLKEEEEKERRRKDQTAPSGQALQVANGPNDDDQTSAEPAQVYHDPAYNIVREHAQVAYGEAFDQLLNDYNEHMAGNYANLETAARLRMVEEKTNPPTLTCKFCGSEYLDGYPCCGRNLEEARQAFARTFLLRR